MSLTQIYSFELFDRRTDKYWGAVSNVQFAQCGYNLYFHVKLPSIAEYFASDLLLNKPEANQLE